MRLLAGQGGGNADRQIAVGILNLRLDVVKALGADGEVAGLPVDAVHFFDRAVGGDAHLDVAGLRDQPRRVFLLQPVIEGPTVIDGRKLPLGIPVHMGHVVLELVVIRKVIQGDGDGLLLRHRHHGGHFLNDLLILPGLQLVDNAAVLFIHLVSDAGLGGGAAAAEGQGQHARENHGYQSLH